MNKKQIGQFIKDERLKRNLTQRELGEKVGIKTGRILEVEKAKKSYGIDNLLTILNGLGIDLLPPVVGLLDRARIYNFTEVIAAIPSDEPKNFQNEVTENLPTPSEKKRRIKQDDKMLLVS